LLQYLAVSAPIRTLFRVSVASLVLGAVLNAALDELATYDMDANTEDEGEEGEDDG